MAVVVLGGPLTAESQWPESSRTTRPHPPRTLRTPVIKRGHDRSWEVRDPRGELVCVTACKRGAVEVVRQLAA